MSPIAPSLIYLDANASEPLRPRARAAAMAAMDLIGNPASIHAAGRRARQILEEARAIVAARFGATLGDVVFTSGGTEANALAIANLGANRHTIVGATEHDAVREATSGASVLPVLPDGRADLNALEAMLAGRPSLLCLMLANNETGVIHPVAEAAALCRAHGALLHVDAVQAAGRMDFSLASLGADSIAISGHKIGGPKGAGALIVRAGLPIAAQLPGGGQERGRRGGTPSLPAIAGLGAALAEAGGSPHLAQWRDRIEAACIAQGAIVCGAGAPRLGNTICLARPGVRADLQVIALDLAGIAVSAGAACSSGKVAASHVLQAMGLAALAGCAIRVSLPWNAVEIDIERFIAAYARLPAPRAAVPA